MTRKTKIIAEMASCHNGDMELAKSMIRAAAENGVDIVKFQSWNAEKVSDDDPDKDRYKKLELSDDDHFMLVEECKKNGVEFLTTCYDIDRIPFLKKLGLQTIKVSSVNLKEVGFLEALSKNFKHVIVSTGMSTKEEIEAAIKILSNAGVNFSILHCVAIYPTPLDRANLSKIEWLKSLTSSVGYSDHTMGIDASVVAISMGIDFLEKHFTLSRYLPQETHTTREGSKAITTHEIASEPHEFKQISEWRHKIDETKGDGHLDMEPEEMMTRKKYTGRFGRTS